MRVTTRRMWAFIAVLWMIPIGIYFLSYRSCSKQEYKQSEAKIKFISLPEEISQAKPGDSITVKINGDTMSVGFYRKDLDSTYYVIKE